MFLILATSKQTDLSCYTLEYLLVGYSRLKMCSFLFAGLMGL